jgi:hypothetical protein
LCTNDTNVTIVENSVMATLAQHIQFILLKLNTGIILTPEWVTSPDRRLDNAAFTLRPKQTHSIHPEVWCDKRKVGQGMGRVARLVVWCDERKG